LDQRRVLAIVICVLLTATVLAPVTAVKATAPDEKPSGSWTQSGTLDYMRYIQVNNFRFDPLAESPDVPYSLSYASVLDYDPVYYIVQFNGPVKSEMKSELTKAGGTILYYVNYNAFVVKANSVQIAAIEDVSSVRWVGTFEPAYKLSPRLSSDYDLILERALESTTAAGLGATTSTADLGTKLQDPVDISSASSSAYTRADESRTNPSVDRTTKTAQSETSVGMTVDVLTFEVSNVQDVAAAISSLGGKDVVFSDEMNGVVCADIDPSKLTALARRPGVMWIDRHVQPFVYNDIARWVLQSGDGATYATPIHDQGIWGTGQTVTVGDTGIDYEHDAFEDPANPTPGPSHRKVTDYYVPSDGGGDGTDNDINHGTHVSGTVAGDDGTWHVYDGDPLGSSGSAGPHDGQAFDAMLQVQDLSPDGYYVFPPSDITDMYSEAMSRGSYIHTNSWGSVGADYIDDAAATDNFIWNNQEFLVLYAAGNPGSTPGYLNPYSAAKNVISVGATLNGVGLEDMADFSGRGPCTDGRLKPDITTPGVNIWSAQGGDPGSELDTYWQLSGTSMATPNAAGSAALVRQYYSDGWYPTGSPQAGNAFTPTAALIKATLINSASEMTGAGAYANGESYYPNNNQGWGRVTLDSALYFQGETRGIVADDERIGLSTGGMTIYELAIGEPSEAVEITLVWSDYAGQPYTNPNLVNDLDLIVMAPDGTLYMGNQYWGQNPGESIPNPNGTDHLNNVESVLVISDVLPGLWMVAVVGLNVPMGPQPYAIVMTGGIATQKGSVGMDHNRYRSDATIILTVVDTDLNLDENATDIAHVVMASSTETVPENVTLTETGPATSAFWGWIQLELSAAPVTGDGVLQVQNRDNITAAYFDEDDGLGGSGFTYDMAVVDDDPPEIMNVSAVNVRYNRATIIWTTDENSDSVVHYGDSIPPLLVKSDARRTTDHSIRLSNLVENTSYAFAIECTDEAGNTAYDDNSTNYYWFLTTVRPPTAPANDEWPTFHNNDPRQGLSPTTMEPPLNASWVDGPNLLSLWTSPVVSDGVLISATLDGYIRARDPVTSEVYWERFLGGQYYYTGTPAVSNGVVYATFTKPSGATEVSNVYAIDIATGDILWSFGEEEGFFFTARIAMAAADGLVFAETWDGMVVALDALNGTLVWTESIGDLPYGGTTVSGGMIFATGVSGRVFGLDEFTGDTVWSQALDGATVGPVLFAQDCVYVGTYGGSMYCLDAGTGDVVWQVPGFYIIDYGGPAYDGSNIYFGSFNGAVYALDATDGSLVWQASVGAEIGNTVAYANGYVYGSNWGGSLFVIDADSGTVVETHSLLTASTSSPAISDGSLFIEDYDGNIYAFNGQLPVGLLVTPRLHAQDVIPGDIVDIRLNVTNIGTSGPDTFDATTTLGPLGWSVELYEADGVTPLGDTDADGIPDTGSLMTDSMTVVVVRISVPAGAMPGDEETATATLTSSNDLAVHKTSTITLSVPPPGVWIGPRGYIEAAPGDLVNATMTVRNTGALSDTIDIVGVSQEGWNFTILQSDGVTPLGDSDGDGIADTGVLAGLGSVEIVLMVEVPTGASMGSMERVTITGTSSLDTNASAYSLLVIELTAPANEDWPTFQNDDARHGMSPCVFAPPLEERWSAGPGYYTMYTGSVYHEGVLYAASIEGFMTAFDAFAGNVIWQRQLGSLWYYPSAPVWEGGVVYVVFDTETEGAAMYALDADTGETIWKAGEAETGMDLNARISPIVAGGLVFGGAWSGELYALDAEDGSVVWTYTTSGSPGVGIAIGGGMLFHCVYTGEIIALDMLTGELIWSLATPDSILTTPLYAQGYVYAMTSSGTMYALEAASGAIVWQTTGLGYYWISCPAYDGHTLFIGSDDGNFRAINSTTGSLLWTLPFYSNIESSPACANGWVYGTMAGYLNVIEPSTGWIAYQYYIGWSTSCLAVADGWIWVSSEDGYMHAFMGQMPVGLTVTPAMQAMDVLPGTSVDFWITVTNTGTSGPDTFDTDMMLGAHNWIIELYESDGVTPLGDSDSDGLLDTGPLATYESADIIARMYIDPMALPGDEDTAVIIFTSSNDLSVSKEARVQALVPPPGVWIGPRAYHSVDPGEIVRTTLTVSNLGALPDTMDIGAWSEHSWNFTLYESDGMTPLGDSDADGVPDTGEIPGLNSVTIVVEIEVPLSAALGSTDRTHVLAISSLDPNEASEAVIVLDLSAPPNDAWPTLQNDNSRRGISPQDMEPPLELQWMDQWYYTDYNSPVYADGVLYWTSNQGHVAAFEAFTGDILWQRDFEEGYFNVGTPTIEGGVLYTTMGSWNGSSSLYALDAATGGTIWQVGASQGFDINAQTSVVVDQGIVFCLEYGGTVLALDASDGSLTWSSAVSTWVEDGLAAASGMIFLGSSDGYAIALDEFDGSILWTQTLDSSVVSVPLISQGTVFFTTNGGTAYALDAGDGSIVWTTSGLGTFYANYAATDGTALFLATQWEGYYALDFADGSILWQVLATPIYSGPAYCNGYVYGAAMDGYLRVMDAEDGSVDYLYGLGSSGSGAYAAIADGWLWVGDWWGGIYGFRGQLPVGLRVQPEEQQKSVVPGSTVDFDMTVTNIGTSGTDVFDAYVTLGASGWAVDLLQANGVTPLADTDGDLVPDTGPLGYQESAEIVVRMTAPGSATIYDEDTARIDFVSSNDIGTSKQATVTALVPPPGVDIGPRASLGLMPGEVADVSLTVANLGAMPDTFDIEASTYFGMPYDLFESDGITPIGDTDGDGVADTGLVQGLESATIVLRIYVPADASPLEYDVVDIIATSALDPDVSDSVPVLIEVQGGADPEWPQHHHDAARTGISPQSYELPMLLEWSSGPASNSLSSYGVVMDDGKVFGTDYDGNVFALDLDTGNTVWSMGLGSSGYFPNMPAVEYGHVYVVLTTDGGASHTLYSLDEDTGMIRWSYEVAGYYDAYTMPAVAVGTVFWCDYFTGKVYANDAFTGALEWEYDCICWPSEGPTYSNGLVYITGEGGTVEAMDAWTGEPAWTGDINNYSYNAPVVSDGVLYIGDVTGTMWAYDAYTGDLIWSSSGFGEISLSSPVVVDGLVIFASTMWSNVTGGYVTALDQDSGDVVWSDFISGAMYYSSVVYSGGYVFAPSDDGWIYVYDVASEIMVYQILVAGSWLTSPALGNGRLVIADGDGYISCFKFEGADEPEVIELTPASADLAVSSSAMFHAVAYDQYGNLVEDAGLEWSLVGSNGTLTPLPGEDDWCMYTAGHEVGQDIIVVTAFNGVWASASISLMAGDIEEVVVTPLSAELEANVSLQFSAAAYDWFGNEVPNVTFVWSVTGAIGTIDASGLLTASTTASSGTVVATVGAISGSAEVSVVPAGLDHLTASSTGLSLLVGGSEALQVQGYDEFDNPISGLTYAWSSTIGSLVLGSPSGESVVFMAGTVPGSGSIRIECGGLNLSIPADVLVGPVVEIVLVPVEATVVVNGTLTFSATAYDVYGNEATGVTLNWTADAVLGTITQAGTLTAAKVPGSGNVNVTYGLIVASARVELVPGALDHLTASATGISLLVGQSQAVQVQGHDEFDNPIPGLTYAWSSTIGSLVLGSPSGESVVFMAGTVPGSGSMLIECGGLNLSIPVDVLVGPVVEIVLAPLEATLGVNGSMTFGATAYDIYGNEVTGVTLNWTADAILGTITQAGTLTAATAPATGNVTVNYGLIVATAHVELVPGTLDHLTASATGISLVVGQSQAVQVQGYDEFDNPIPGLTYAWSATVGSVVLGSPSGDSIVFVAGTLPGSGSLRADCGSETLLIPVQVSVGPVAQITISPGTATIVVNGSASFGATARDAFGNIVSGATLTWSADAAIGTVTQAGAFKAATVPATGFVTVTSGSVVAKASVEVVAGAPHHIVVTPASSTISAGSSQALGAVVYDAFNNVLNDATVSWSSSLGSVAALNGMGTLAAYSAPTTTGSATLNASSGSVYAHATVTVVPGALASLSINPGSPSVVAGSTATFTAAGEDVYGNAISGLTLTWSANAAIGTVSQAGVLTASTHVGSGKVTVTALGVSSWTDVLIVPGAISQVEVRQDALAGPSSMQAGELTYLYAKAMDQYGNEISGAAFTWSASAGQLDPLSMSQILGPTYTYTAPTLAGSATVTVTSGGASGSLVLTIGPSEPAEISMTPDSETLQVGASLTFEATVIDVYGNEISGYTIDWSASAGSISDAGVLTAPTVPGSLVVVASAAGKEAHAVVTLVPGVLDHLEVSPTAVSLKTGEGMSLSVVCLDQYGNEIADTGCSWTTDIGEIDPSVDGSSAAFAAGETAGSGTITVSMGGESADVTVEVENGKIPVARQITQPASLAFLIVAIALALLLAFVFMRSRKLKQGA